MSEQQNTEQAIMVRQITDVYANWSSKVKLQDGKFSYHLILDNGAEEAPMAAPSNRARNGAPHCSGGVCQQRRNSP